jgi:hypothetical protein
MRARCSSVMPGRRRLLDHLLVAALHRAVALAEVDHVAVVSASTWNSMWRGLLEEFLHVDLVVAEGGRASRACQVDRRSAVASLCTTRMPRPPPPPAALMMTG